MGSAPQRHIQNGGGNELVLKWSRLGKNNGSSEIVVDPFLLFLFSPALQVPTWPETMGPPRFFFPGASFRGYVDPLAVPHSRRLLAFLQWTGAGRGAAQQWNGRGGGAQSYLGNGQS